MKQAELMTFPPSCFKAQFHSYCRTDTCAALHCIALHCFSSLVFPSFLFCRSLAHFSPFFLFPCLSFDLQPRDVVIFFFVPKPFSPRPPNLPDPLRSSVLRWSRKILRCTCPGKTSSLTSCFIPLFYSTQNKPRKRIDECNKIIVHL